MFSGVSLCPGLSLPISAWWRRCDTGSFDEVGEVGEVSPYDGRPRWRADSTVEIASEACNRPDMEIKIARCLSFRPGRVRACGPDCGNSPCARRWRMIFRSNRERILVTTQSTAYTETTAIRGAAMFRHDDENESLAVNAMNNNLSV